MSTQPATVPFSRIRVHLQEPVLEDVGAHTERQLDLCGVVIAPGSRVAIALGSRGIGDLATVVARVAAWVRRQGAHPFLVPAMGSHGGATAEGQQAVLEAYGLGEEHLGCPIVSTMEVVELPRGECPVPVYTDAAAANAEAIIMVNRVKPHTDFHGPYESGLMKMIAIGLGKQKQADALHAYGQRGLREFMPLVARQVLEHGNVVLGVAIIENALDATMDVRAVPAARIAADEPALLATARAHSPHLPMDALDVLLVDRMGKDISGVGMDTNVIGRMLITGQLPAQQEARGDDVGTGDLMVDGGGHRLGDDIGQAHAGGVAM